MNSQVRVYGLDVVNRVEKIRWSGIDIKVSQSFIFGVGKSVCFGKYKRWTIGSKLNLTRGGKVRCTKRDPQIRYSRSGLSISSCIQVRFYAYALEGKYAYDWTDRPSELHSFQSSESMNPSKVHVPDYFSTISHLEATQKLCRAFRWCQNLRKYAERQRE